MLKDLNRDFQDLINCLTSQSVEFMVVGAHALAFHGIARFTNDLDIWIRRTEENTERLRIALNEFGVPISRQEAQQLLGERKFLKLGNEPRRVDILNFLDGVEFDSAYARSSREVLDEAHVAIIGLDDYVATKRASGRAKDFSDLALLRSQLGPLPGD